MGLRGELFSTKVQLVNRTYFFNIKENRNGDLYLNMVESKNRETGGFDRQSVIVFAEDLQEFLSGFDDALRVLEKEVREKRRSGPRSYGPRSYEPRPEGGDRGRRGEPWRDRGEDRDGRYRERGSFRKEGGDSGRGSWGQARRENPGREDFNSQRDSRVVVKPRREDPPRDD